MRVRPTIMGTKISPILISNKWTNIKTSGMLIIIIITTTTMIKMLTPIFCRRP